MGRGSMRDMYRAFSPRDFLGAGTWAVGPGWYVVAPSALGPTGRLASGALRRVGGLWALAVDCWCCRQGIVILERYDAGVLVFGFGAG